MSLRLWRVLFPSWRFFAESGVEPVLWRRSRASSGDWGEWEPCFVPAERHWGSLLLNVEGNLRLAGKGLVERLLEDIAEADENALASLASGVSYGLVSRWVRFGLAEQGAGGKFQFKITVGSDDALVSLTHEV